MVAPDWQTTISIAGVTAIVNVALTLIVNAVYIGRKSKEWDAAAQRSCRNEVDVQKLREAFSAITGKTINGSDYRRR